VLVSSFWPPRPRMSYSMKCEAPRGPSKNENKVTKFDLVISPDEHITHPSVQMGLCQNIFFK